MMLYMSVSISEELAPKVTLASQLGPTLTVHLGPGSLVLVPFYSS
jgi:hypothetical protein